MIFEFMVRMLRTWVVTWHDNCCCNHFGPPFSSDQNRSEHHLINNQHPSSLSPPSLSMCVCLCCVSSTSSLFRNRFSPTIAFIFLLNFIFLVFGFIFMMFSLFFPFYVMMSLTRFFPHLDLNRFVYPFLCLCFSMFFDLGGWFEKWIGLLAVCDAFDLRIDLLQFIWAFSENCWFSATLLVGLLMLKFVISSM